MKEMAVKAEKIERASLQRRPTDTSRAKLLQSQRDPWSELAKPLCSPSCKTTLASLSAKLSLSPPLAARPVGLPLQRGLAPPVRALQAKLVIGAADDEYEREADRVAEQAVSMPELPVQRQGEEEDEEKIQTKPLAGQITPLIPRQMEEGPLQGRFGSNSSIEQQPQVEPEPNRTEMPVSLQAGLEQLSGLDLSYARVHYNSAKPAQLNAFAYTQGQNIEVGPGQERHLPHEGWHVVQQMQGRVKPMLQARGVSFNDDAALEREADLMGANALQMMRSDKAATNSNWTPKTITPPALRLFSPAVQRSSLADKAVIQRKTVLELNQEAQPQVGQQANLDGIRSQYATMTIGATHIGDMYHLKAAKAIFPDLNTMICDVNAVDNHATVNSAFIIGNYMNDLPKTYYTNSRKPTEPAPTTEELQGVAPPNIAWRKWVEEGKVTSLIMYGSMNSANADPNVRDLIKEGTAPIGGVADETAFNQALISHNFRKDTSYVLVNFRGSGHLGGAHPALDTGPQGYNQIINAVQTRFPAAQVVPMGEILPAGIFLANLVNYWTWPCCTGDRKKQAGLLRYLNENFTILGAVGMRSGIMDMLAFAGIPVISIDISPEKPGGTSLGWERGSKLERVLGPRYGRSFIKQSRQAEQGITPEGWAGQFQEADMATIGASIGTYFGPGSEQLAPGYKDPSHPLFTGKLDALIQRLTGSLPNHENPPVFQPRTPISNEDRTYMNKIKNLLRVDYTRVPHGQSYYEIINNLLRYA